MTIVLCYIFLFDVVMVTRTEKIYTRIKVKHLGGTVSRKNLRPQKLYIAFGDFLLLQV